MTKIRQTPCLVHGHWSCNECLDANNGNCPVSDCKDGMCFAKMLRVWFLCAYFISPAKRELPEVQSPAPTVPSPRVTRSQAKNLKTARKKVVRRSEKNDDDDGSEDVGGDDSDGSGSSSDASVEEVLPATRMY